jgi:3-phenylpropionate/cinnamic acid dioxygenase small subunit
MTDVALFLYREARLLDEKRWDEWLTLFTEDARYWVPLARDQADGETHTSLAYEDILLLRLRVERLKRHPPSQRPASWSQHVLQAPGIEAVEGGWRTRTPFHYTEARGDAVQMYAGVALHELLTDGGGVRIRLKRINLVNCDAALPSVQLFL